MSPRSYEKMLSITVYNGNANQNHNHPTPVKTAIIRKDTNNERWQGCGEE